MVAATLALATRESQREEFEDSLRGQWDIVQLLQVHFPRFFIISHVFQKNSPLLVDLHVLPYDSLGEVAFALPGNTCLESLDCSLDM